MSIDPRDLYPSLTVLAAHFARRAHKEKGAGDHTRAYVAAFLAREFSELTTTDRARNNP